MCGILGAGAALALLGLGALPAPAAQRPEADMLTPVDFTAVRITDSFWKQRLDTNRDQTLPHCLDWCERTHRIANFDVAAGKVPGKHEGYFFNDSDVYKTIEGAAYILAVDPDPAMQARIEAVIDRILAAQQPDGYLNTYFQVARPGQRWTDDSKHELYCLGTLIEAGLAWQRATGQRRLLDAAIRYVEHVDSVFGPGKRLEAPEHPEIELALIKLWRATNEPRYLKLARFFLDQRGQPRGRPGWGEYAQDHQPLRAQREVVGHAVRATYLYAAATDMLGITDDIPAFHDALESLWRDLTTRKMYITGGIGVSTQNEGFTQGYDLPNQNAYAETCASIGLAFWAHRMALRYQSAAPLDIFERAAYNGILSGVSLEGDKFLYVNPLMSHGPATFRAGGGQEGESTCHRQQWFRCACCPPNVLRFIGASAGYVYACSDDAIYVNLYVDSEAKIPWKGGAVVIRQKTDYPWDGKIALRVDAPADAKFDLWLRQPGWAREFSLEVSDRRGFKPERRLGYIQVPAPHPSGERITLEFPMPVERIECDPRVVPNRGRLALQRGPLVYCLEEVDNPGGVLNLAIPRDAELIAEHRPALLGGVTAITGPAVRAPVEAWDDRLYRPARAVEKATFTAVPYCVWDNRAPGGMCVWIPEAPGVTVMPPADSQPATR